MSVDPRCVMLLKEGLQDHGILVLTLTDYWGLCSGRGSMLVLRAAKAQLPRVCDAALRSYIVTMWLIARCAALSVN